MKRMFIFFIVLLFHKIAAAQDRSNKGKEFWLGYGHSYSFTYDDGPGAPINSQTLTLYISAEEAARVTISVSGTSWSQVVNIPANSVDYSIVLPKNGPSDCRILDEGLSGRGVHIESNVPIVVYAHEFNTQLSGATMLMPVETYGYSYYSVNYTQSQFFFDVYSWFFIVASEDNTRLEITPSADTKGGWLAGNTYTVNLNKGEIYNVFGKINDGVSNDMTGSKVVSISGADGKCHPVAMFSGASIIRFCSGDGGEIIKQQVFPLSAWGTRYLTWHMLVNATGNITTPFPNFYRVIVKDPATVVKRNGVPLTGLINNRYYEFTSTDGDYIEADNPILVAQYSPNANKCVTNNQTSLGDPEMFFLSPIEQGMRQVTFYSTKNTVITVNYISAIVPATAIASVRIDGAPLVAANYITHPNNSNYKVVVKRLLGAAAQHTIKCDSAFSSLVYGLGNFESYGYTAGTLINNLNSISSIHNTYNSTSLPNTFTCPKSPFQLTIKIAYRASAINWLFTKVSGISPAGDTLITNPVATDSSLINGREYFTYTLTSDHAFNDTGTYYIPVTYTSDEIDHCSHEESTAVEVVVKQGPITDFTITHAGCLKDTAYFKDATIANGYTIDRNIWYYDDDTRDSSIASQKLFTAETNTVTYRTIATNGCLKDTTKIITVSPQPIAKASYTRDICLGDSMLFSTRSSVASGSVVQYNWDFGDGNKKTLASDIPFYHKYSSKGDYRVMLTVISDKGCVSDTFFLPVKVLDKPTASFTYSGKPCIDSTISFTPVTKPSISSTSSWYWNFGDGQILTGTGNASVTHAFTSASTNSMVKFVANTSPGCVSDTVANIITINPKPIAGFTMNAVKYCAGETVNFTGNSSSNIATWLWDFGNGSATTDPTVTRIFPTGMFDVQLKVISDKGCVSDAIKQTLTINAIPVINAGPDIKLKEGNSVMIAAMVNDAELYTYKWSPAAGLNSTTDLTPVTNTRLSTTYVVTASGGPGNCTATDSVNVIVFKQLYVPNAFSPNRDGVNDVWNIPALDGAAVVTIFNRWGQIIYQSNGYTKPWDGTYMGQPQPMGAYFYIIQPDVQKPEKLSGSVMLIR